MGRKSNVEEKKEDAIIMDNIEIDDTPQEMPKQIIKAPSAEPAYRKVAEAPTYVDDA